MDNYIRRSILAKLLFSNGEMYSNLRPKPSIENNTLTFHVNTLKSDGLIEKNQDGLYILTKKGKIEAAKIDTETEHVVKQAKIGVMIAPFRGEEDVIEILLYTRKKHPFFYCQGMMTGKVRYGEAIVDAAKRELYEETCLTGDIKVKAVRRYIDTDATGSLLEDKFFRRDSLSLFYMSLYFAYCKK